MAGKGDNADWFREDREIKGIKTCIPAPRERKSPEGQDRELDRQRHRIENLFASREEWRRIATRYDRCGEFCLPAIGIAVIVMFGL